MGLGDVLISSIETIYPQPGDMVVVTVDPDASPDALRSLAEHLRRWFADNQVLVLAGATLAVLTAEDLARLGLRRVP